MKKLLLAAICCVSFAIAASALSVGLKSPEIYFSKSIDAKLADQVEAVLKAPEFKFVDGLTSYWEPDFSTILVYDGEAAQMREMLAKLRQIPGISVKVTVSKDLAAESGTGISAGAWWVKYRHTAPAEIELRLNLSKPGFDEILSTKESS